MWRLGQALATPSFRRGVCVLVALVAAGGPEARAAVTVRAVEVGNRGEVAPEFPAAVRAEISTDVRVDGSFRSWLARSPGSAPGSPGSSPAGHSGSVRLRLEPGEIRLLTAYLADLPYDACSGFDFRWSVADTAGRPLAEGVQPVRCARQRVLYLTDAAVPFAQRSPAAAFDGVQSYSEYETCLISGRGFAGLREEQREALLDRASLGSTLVLTAPLASAGAELDRRLGAADALVWRDASGREVREARFHLGIVRTADRSLPELAQGADSPLGRLLVSDGPVLPVVDGSALREVTFRGRYGGIDWNMFSRSEDAVRLGRLVSTVAFALLGLVIVGLWWATRPRVACSARAVWAVATALALSPALAYVAAASLPVANRDGCMDLVIHDGPGGLQSRWSRATVGSGGGRQDPLLVNPPGPRSIWAASRVSFLERSLQVEQEDDGHLRVGLGRRGLGVDRLLFLSRAEASPDDPAWDATDVAVREGRLAGTLRTRRPLARLALVGPPGVAWFGSVRSGERIDLSAPRWTALAVWPPPEAEPLERVASGLWNLRYGALHPVRFYAIGAEPSSCTIAVAAGGEPPAPCTVHVQPLGADPAAELTSTLPAEQVQQEVRVQVPEVVAQRMRSRGLSFVPDVPFLETSRDPDVSREVVDGFREIVFRVGGAAQTPPRPFPLSCHWRRARTRHP